METRLTMQYLGRRQYQPAAVLICSGHPEVWLNEVCARNASTSQLRFLPVHDGTSAAVLCIGPGVAEAWQGSPFQTHHDSPALEFDFRFVPYVFYGCRAGRLFLPADADLRPVVSDSELAGMLGDRSFARDAEAGPNAVSSQNRIYVWHPSAGLVGYDPEHVLTIEDLLIAPDVPAADCRDIPLVETAAERIRELLPEPELPVDDILEQGADDIGSDPEGLSDAPRAPDEKSLPSVRDLLNRMRHGAASAIHGLTSRLPSTNHGSRFLGQLHQWAESVLSSIGSAAGGAGGGFGAARGSFGRTDSGLNTRRENEIKRLLNLLDKDPDRGLKYALPVSDGTGFRGQARPTDRLGERSIDFQLGQLRSGGRADAWSLPWEYHIRLLARYRALAQREQQLGRYRRAAYIYAVLIGDLSAAAAALEAGEFFHDAAAIHRERLHNPVAAAACLRRGGYWEEAVQIYRSRECWMEAGELYRQMNQPR
ncbi:MAG: hypothetical protein KDA89_21025, partial [Planctomycetaceae bacterium]|nr:hypothetical protein [Planctomycetaceae bacterium]